MKSFFHHIGFIGFNGLRAEFSGLFRLFRFLFDNKPATALTQTVRPAIKRCAFFPLSLFSKIYSGFRSSVALLQQRTASGTRSQSESAAPS
jgi:hypothetical protein